MDFENSYPETLFSDLVCLFHEYSDFPRHRFSLFGNTDVFLSVASTLRMYDARSIDQDPLHEIRHLNCHLRPQMLGKTSFKLK